MPLPPPPIENSDASPVFARWLQQLWEAVRVLQADFTWNPGNLLDGTGETSAAVTVTGATLGDFAVAGAPYDLQGITCTAYVSAADTVRVRLQNETGGPIDLADGTWNVRVFRKQ